MPRPGELAALTAELTSKMPEYRFNFEWSSPAQGGHLLLCGDWNRQGRRTSRTLQDPSGKPIKRGRRQLSTDERLRALEAATSLVCAYAEGSATKQRKKRVLGPSSSLLVQQRQRLMRMIREREGGTGAKTKHLRHCRALFEWLDERNCLLDSVNAIGWAGDGVKRNTDNYSDRLRVAKWACGVNNLVWILPENKRAQKPGVKRPFVDAMSDHDLSALFPLVKDPEARTFLRVIAATGCRPSEVLLFDWERWQMDGRPNYIDGFSRKKGMSFTAICNPVEWLDDAEVGLLSHQWSRTEIESSCEIVAAELTRRYSRLLKLVQQDLRAAGIKHVPTWTDFRHLWTIRAELGGINRNIGAAAQAHSEKMARDIYLRHGKRSQVISEAKRLASMSVVAS